MDEYEITNIVRQSKDPQRFFTKQQERKIKSFEENIKGKYKTTASKNPSIVDKIILMMEQKNLIENFIYRMANLIKATGRIEEYLDSEDFDKYELYPSEIRDLICETNNIQKYLTPEYVVKFGFGEENITDLIYMLEKEEFEKFLFKNQEDVFTHYIFDIANVIKAKGNIEEYLTIENIIKYYLNPRMITDLIKETNLEEKYRGNSNENSNPISEQFSIDDILNSSSKLNEYIKESKNEQIILPSNMKVGIEIESVGTASSYILENKYNFGKDNFFSKIEPSVYQKKDLVITAEGLEATSPIFTGNFKEASESIKRVCAKLALMRSKCRRKMWWSHTF